MGLRFERFSVLLQPVESGPDQYRDKGKREACDQVKLEWGEMSIGIWPRVFDAI